MKPKTPKQPRALRLADAILKPDCTKTNKENAANELRKLYELNQELYKMMNESWTLQSAADRHIGLSMNELSKAIQKSRDAL